MADKADKWQNKDTPWRDKETLRQLYWEDGKSCYEVADELGCGYQTVLNWLQKTGLGSRKSTQDKHGHFRLCKGYERFETKVDGSPKGVQVHRLVALANGIIDTDDFLDSKTVVHHENGIKWDNRPSNLTRMSFSGHMKHHMEERDRDEQGRVTN